MRRRSQHPGGRQRRRCASSSRLTASSRPPRRRSTCRCGLEWSRLDLSGGGGALFLLVKAVLVHERCLSQSYVWTYVCRRGLGGRGGIGKE
eukprot:13427-Chlamydomonas_euryale.AAC.1